MNYIEFKEICRKIWTDNFYYLFIDVTKIKTEGKYRTFNESKEIF